MAGRQGFEPRYRGPESVNGLRSVPLRSVLFQSSLLSLQWLPLRSALFTHQVSQSCLRSGPKRFGLACPYGRSEAIGLGRSKGRHRSTHSTNAGGISSCTIITRAIRSSRSSGSAPRRAASTVEYRVHAAERDDADPRLTVVISLNMSVDPETSLARCRSPRCPGLHKRERSLHNRLPGHGGGRSSPPWGVPTCTTGAIDMGHHHFHRNTGFGRGGFDGQGHGACLSIGGKARVRIRRADYAALTLSNSW